MAKRFGARLRRARLAQDISQGALATKLGVAQPTVCNWEYGRTEPDAGTLKKLTRILGRFDVPAATKRDNSRNDEEDEEVEVGGGRAFADWLRKARASADMSVPELAEASKVSVVQIYNLEAGRSVNPRDATKKRLEKALGAKVPEDVEEEVADEQAIEGLGPLTDFDPHDEEDRPGCGGVYVFYDISDRPVYVGKARSISTRVGSHARNAFWFRAPIVNHGAYVEIGDEKLRHQVEQVLIKFLKSNAVINKQSVERD
jgi:transcriptional regulator with XRE-family HTH domain